MITVLLSIFFGVLISQLIYNAANWLQFKRKDYISYFLYILLLFIYFIIIHQNLLFGLGSNGFLKFFLRPIAFGIYAMYFTFVIDFLETAIHFVRFHRYIVRTRNALIGFSAVFLVINLFAPNSILASTLYHMFNVFIFISSVWLIISLWKNQTKLSTYILRGALAVSIGAFISNIFMILHEIKFLETRSYYLLFVALGVIIELYFFNSGLTFKSRQLELSMIDSQKQLIEELKHSQELTTRLENIRQKISRDLHDEVGATLSGIVMYSYIAKEHIMNLEQEKVNHSLSLIKENAEEMVGKLNDIVWTVNPIQDQLMALIERLKEFTFQIASAKDIRVEFAYQEKEITILSLEMGQRKNIYLIAKEAINNAVKYSNATILKINIEVVNQYLNVNITDNGIGFKSNILTNGNGLVNMEARAKEIGAMLKIDGHTGDGTKIILNCKIT